MHYGFSVNGTVEDKKATGNGQVGDLTVQTDNGQESSNIVKMQQLALVGGASGVEPATSLYDICPECGTGSLAYEEGCRKCYSCGYAEC